MRSDAASILYSYNAETFASVNISGGGKIASIANNSIIYVGVGSGGVFYSSDGLNWTQNVSGTMLLDNSNNTTTQIGKVIWNGSIWVAVGNGTSYTIIYSSDGINWTGVSNSTTLFDIAGGALDLAWNGSIWVVTGANSTGKLIATSSDGMTWTSVTTFSVV
jgi:hypothetical protein